MSLLWKLPGVSPPFPHHNFPKLEHPQLSKVLQMMTFVCPFLYKNFLLFYPVSQGSLRQESGAPNTPEGSLLLLTLLPTAPLLLRLCLE